MTVAPRGHFHLSPFLEWRLRETTPGSVRAELRCTGVDGHLVRSAVLDTLDGCAIAGAVVVGADRGGLLSVGHADLREKAAPTAGVASMVTDTAAVAQGMELRYAQSAPAEWTVTVSASSLVADPTAVRLVQRAIADRLTGAVPDEPPVEPYLKYLAWQRVLAERAAPTDPAPAVPADGRFHVERAADGPATPQWLSIDLSDTTVKALASTADRTGVPVAAALLASWRMLVEAWTDQPGLPITVGVDGRQPPVPADLSGQATQWRSWSAPAGTSQTMRDRLVAAAGWLTAIGADPTWPVGTGRTAVGFLPSPAPAETVRGERVVVLDPPVPDPVGTVVTLVPSVGPDRGQLGLWFDDSRILGDDATAMLRTLESLLGGLDAMLDDPGGYAGARPAAVTADRVPPSLWSRVTSWAQRTPEACALTDGTEQVSYRELTDRAQAVAGALVDAGVGPDSRVGILAEESPRLVVAMLGVLRAGAAYVPLNPRQPRPRLAGMVEAAQVDVVLVEEHLRNLDVGGRPVPLGAATSAAAAAATAVPSAHSDDLAYVLFTSGSTGAPKGVMVTRRGLDNYVDVVVSSYLAGPGDVVSFTSPGFDLTVTSLLAPLAAGRTVRMVSSERGLDEVTAAMGSGPVCLLKLTPSHLTLLTGLLASTGGPRVGTMVVGGEPLTVDVAEAWHARQPDCVIVNEYGPTETVVGCTTWRYDGSERGFRDVPIGYPVAGAAVYVVDERLRPVVDLARGELAIGGAGVARGYAGAPRATAERFVPDPFGPPGSRMYLSGDVGFRSPAHGLRFAGRRDAQISLHGYRIEPGEVEAALRQVDGVAEAVVRTAAPAGDRVLVGYVVPVDGARLDGEAVRAELAERLPGYLIPRYVVALGALPLTANGKLDDTALGRVPLFAHATGATTATTELERAVQAVWGEVLGIDEPSLDARFFELGGTSFGLVTVVARLREVVGREIPVADFFEHPTIREFAAYLAGQQPDTHDAGQRAALRRSGTELLRQRRAGR